MDEEKTVLKNTMDPTLIPGLTVLSGVTNYIKHPICSYALMLANKPRERQTETDGITACENAQLC